MCFNHTYPCLSSPGYNLFLSSQTLCPLIKFHLCSLSYVAFHWRMVPIPGTAPLKETQSPCHYLVVAICSSAKFGSSTLFPSQEWDLCGFGLLSSCACCQRYCVHLLCCIKNSFLVIITISALTLLFFAPSSSVIPETWVKMLWYSFLSFRVEHCSILFSDTFTRYESPYSSPSNINKSSSSESSKIH